MISCRHSPGACIIGVLQLWPIIALKFHAYEPITVSIWFDKEATRRIRERIWHSSQHIEVNESDGSCILTMTVTGLDTVTRWVLSFDQHAMPRSPKCFVNKVQKAVKGMAVAYELFC